MPRHPSRSQIPHCQHVRNPDNIQCKNRNTQQPQIYDKVRSRHSLDCRGEGEIERRLGAVFPRFQKQRTAKLIKLRVFRTISVPNCGGDPVKNGELTKEFCCDDT